MKISDKLRTFASTEALNPIQTSTLKHVADRIDKEMAELPKDADGVPIHVNDLVWLDNGRRACVTEIDIKDGCEVIDCWDGSRHVPCQTDGITRNLPDSWNFIADELDEMVDAARSADDGCEKLADLIDPTCKVVRKRCTQVARKCTRRSGAALSVGFRSLSLSAKAMCSLSQKTSAPDVARGRWSDDWR